MDELGNESLAGSDDQDSRTSRRDALVKIGAAGALAWATPTLLSLNSPAAAASAQCTCGERLTANWSTSPGGRSPNFATIGTAGNEITDAVILVTVPAACRGATARFSWTSLVLTNGATGVNFFVNGNPTTPAGSSAGSGSVTFTVPSGSPLTFLVQHQGGLGDFTMSGMNLTFC